jgi:Flp pilus assembly protein TadB
MSPSSAQAWTRRIRPSYYDNMRVSDAERAEVADLLGRHYSDGRLDKQEFDERVARAMSAKTRGDLDGLFDDLPPLDSPAGDATRERPGGPGGLAGPAGPHAVGRRHRGAHPVLIVAAAVILASLAWHGLAPIFFVPWLAIIVLVAVVVYANRHSRRARR